MGVEIFVDCKCFTARKIDYNNPQINMQICLHHLLTFASLKFLKNMKKKTHFHYSNYVRLSFRRRQWKKRCSSRWFLIGRVEGKRNLKTRLKFPDGLSTIKIVDRKFIGTIVESCIKNSVETKLGGIYSLMNSKLSIFNSHWEFLLTSPVSQCLIREIWNSSSSFVH